MDFELLRGSGRRVLKTRKFQSGGGHHKPSGTEIPRGCGGVKIKKTSVGGGGVWIFSGTAQFVTHNENLEIETVLNVQKEVRHRAEKL